MKEELAERLLSTVMDWQPEDLAREREWLLDMAAYKYDHYRQFSPGMRFIGSLALWLSQFEEQEERKIAYKFVKERLVFVSHFEMTHLVHMAYPDEIRPWLIKRAAEEMRIPEWNVGQIVSSAQFRQMRRRCLFLGMSDGAHVDDFRRANKSEVSHEQVLQTYDISQRKASDVQDKLRSDLKELLKSEALDKENTLQTVILLDDFSGSGTSIIRKNKGNASEFEGKMAIVCQALKTNGLGKIVADSDLHVAIVLYVATEKARNHLKELCPRILGDKAKFTLLVVHPFDCKVPLESRIPSDSPFLSIVAQDRYYDSVVEDDHTRKGGENVKAGFASCSLPVVLTHNTPNNSFFLLWADPESLKKDLRGLFPRIQRHGGNP